MEAIPAVLAVIAGAVLSLGQFSACWIVWSLCSHWQAVGAAPFTFGQPVIPTPLGGGWLGSVEKGSTPLTEVHLLH